MSASFDQYLRLEISRLSHVGEVRSGQIRSGNLDLPDPRGSLDGRQQLDKLSVDEIVRYFKRFIGINYAQALVGSVRDDMHRDILQICSEAEPAARLYDMQGGPGTPIGSYFNLIDNPTPRETLVARLESLAESLARRWRSVVAPQPDAIGVHKGRVRPLKPGYSVGNVSAAQGAVNGAGTIGGFIRSKHGVFLLSNAHVLTADPFVDNDRSSICQPGPGDGGAEVIADVAFYCRLQRGAPNHLDAALAKLRNAVAYSFEYESVGPLTGIRDAQVGETLTLVARTTGVIRAVVQSVNSSTLVTDWTMRNGSDVQFSGVTILKRAQAMYANLAGDSGGMWIGEDNKGVALNFGGGEDSETALAIPIRKVVSYFQGVLGDNRAGLVGIDNATFAV